MAYTETSTQGYFSRIGNSIKGVLFGGALFLGAFPLLFQNEGCTVRAYNGIAEGKGAVEETPLDKIDSTHDKKLVHVSGEATTTETLQDKEFNISNVAIRLVRDVEMYQWDEEIKETKKKNLGGSETTVKEYLYEKKWSSSRINSSSFHDKGREEWKKEKNVRVVNPSEWPFSSASQSAMKVTLGAHILSSDLASQINKSEPLAVNDAMLQELPEAQKKIDVLGDERAARINAGEFYYGANPSSPQVGDMKVSFSVVKPMQVSILAQQAGDTFAPYVTRANPDEPINRLEVGVHAAAEMFKNMEGEATMRLWIIRGVGFFMMFLGLSMLMAPLQVLADVVPFIGSIVGVGTGLVAGLLAAFFALTTIAVAWLIYHPLIGGAILAVAIGFLVLLKFLAGKKAPPTAAPA